MICTNYNIIFVGILWSSLKSEEEVNEKFESLKTTYSDIKTRNIVKLFVLAEKLVVKLFSN